MVECLSRCSSASNGQINRLGLPVVGHKGDFSREKNCSKAVSAADEHAHVCHPLFIESAINPAMKQTKIGLECDESPMT